MVDTNIDKLILALKYAVSGVPSEIKEAEKYFEERKKHPLFIPHLLIACQNKDFSNQVRLTAALQMKNYIDFNWKFNDNMEYNKALILNEKDEIIVIPSNDKALLKDEIVQIIGKCEFKPLLKTLIESTNKVIKFDFVAWRNKLMSDITVLLNSNDESQIYAGLSLYYEITKVYEFETNTNRALYLETFNNILPGITAFADNLKDKLDHEVGLVILKKILKIFYRTIQSSLPKLLQETTYFEKWLFILLTVISNIKGNDSEDGNTDTNYFKVGTTVMNIIYRIYQKYATLMKTDDVVMKDFSLSLDQNYSGKVLDVFFNLLEKTKTQHFPSKIVCFIYKFFSRQVVKGIHMDKFAPNLEVLLNEFIVQTIILNKKDIALRSEDQKEYIYRQFDISLTFYDKRSAACQFIKAVCEFSSYDTKTKKTSNPEYFNSIFSYIVSLFEKFEKEVQSGTQPNPLIKEAIMLLFETIAPIALEQKKFTSHIENIIKLYILPELNYENKGKFSGILKERACFVIKCYSKADFKDELFIKSIVQSLCNLLTDQDLSVRIFTSVTLPFLTNKPAALIFLQDHIKSLLEVYLSLMNQIDLEELLVGLESIIEKFGNGILGFSVELTMELVKQFNRLIKSNIEEDEGEGQMAAEGVITAIQRIVSIVSQDNELLSQIEKIIEPLIKHCLSAEGFEMLDDGVEMVRVLINKSNKITPLTWQYFTLICYSLIGDDEENNQVLSQYPDSALEGIGYDNLDELLVLLHSFVTKDPVRFITTKDFTDKLYIDRLLLTLNQILKNSNNSKEKYNQRLTVSRCMISIIDSVTSSIAKGVNLNIDQYIESIITFAISDIDKLKKQHFTYKSSLIQLVASSLLYNIKLTMSVLTKLSASETLLSLWFKYICEVKSERQLNKNLFGLSALIHISPEFPSYKVDSNRITPNLMNNIVLLGEKIVEIQANKKNKKEDVEEDGDDMLDHYLKQAKDNMDDDEDELLEDDSFGDFDDLVYAEDFETEIDRQNSLLYLKNILKKLSFENNNYYMQLIGCLSNDKQKSLERIVIG